MVIKPTVGRVVWFLKSRDTERPLAAMIAHVHSDSMVNLGVLDCNGESYGQTSVPLVQEGETPPEFGSFCMWMPYQIGQAAKAEQIRQLQDKIANAPPGIRQAVPADVITDDPQSANTITPLP